MKKIFGLIYIVSTLLMTGLLLTGCGKKSKYDINRDKKFKSPSGEYSITLRYDSASRPYIFKDDKLIFETNKSGFNETVYFNIEWESEDDIILYIDMNSEKYKNDIYHIHIN